MINVSSGGYTDNVIGYTLPSGNDATADTEWRFQNGGYAQVVYAINGVQADLKRLEFFCLDAVSMCYVQRKYTATNEHGTTNVDWGNQTYLHPNYMLTATNGGWLLTLANQYKDVYFGGVTQTAATLYEYMRDRYGDYPAFAYNNLVGGNLYFDPDRRVPNIVTATYSQDYVISPPNHTFTPADVVSFTGEGYIVPNDIISDSDMCAFLIFGDRISPDNYKCVVDFYFNGTKEPNISIQWQGYYNDAPSDDDILRASKLHIVNYAPWDIQQPPLYGYYTYIDEETGLRRMNDVVFNASNKQRYIKPAAPEQIKTTSFLAQVSAIIGSMNSAEKIAKYGINGLPEKLVWYLQVEDPQGNFSSLWEVYEPRESATGLVGYTVTEFSNSTWPGAQVMLEVNIHEGVSDDEIEDDDTTPPPPPPKPDPDDWDDDEGHGFSGDAVLTKTYSMTASILENIGQKLWTQSYFDVLKIQSNPIENIVSVKWFPFNLNVGTNENVVVGNVDFGIQAKKINTVKRINIGSVTYNGVYATGPNDYNYLDCSPYTTLKLNLPYVGQIQLDASEFYKCTIGVEYIIDLVTGECVARVKRDGIPLYDYPGHMGVDIILTSSDRVQADMKALQSGIHTAASAAGEMVQGDVIGAAAGAASGALSVAGMDYNTQRVGSPSGVCGSFQSHKVWLTVSYPLYYQSDGFTHVFGRPMNRYVTINQVFKSGDYIQVDKRTDLKIAMTSEENRMLEELLTNGVYV